MNAIIIPVTKVERLSKATDITEVVKVFTFRQSDANLADKAPLLFFETSNHGTGIFTIFENT